MSFHDEPLVFDNGPLGVDIGPQHDATSGLFTGGNVSGGVQTFLRKASLPERIMVLVKNNPSSGPVDLFEASHLHTSTPVTFTLKDGSRSATVVLKWDALTRSELTIEVTGIELERESNTNPRKRRLKPTAGSGAPKIETIQWSDGTTMRTVDLKDTTSGQLRHENVYVALF